MLRGEVWWADLPDPVASEPGYRRPVLIVQSDVLNRSRINTMITAVISSNLRLAGAPDNVQLTAGESGLPKNSIVNVSQLITIDKSFLTERVEQVSNRTMQAIEGGLRLVLEL